MPKRKNYSKVIYIFTLLLIILYGFLYSCTLGDYRGKAIANIEYVTIDYGGGYTQEQVVDLEKGEVRSRIYIFEEEKPDYLVETTFAIEKVPTLMNEIHRAGLLRLKEHYPSPGGIDDGGGWTLKINYVDGSIRYSSGENHIPKSIFQKADYAFYHLYGRDLFGTLPSDVLNPPHFDIAYQYTDGKINYSQSEALSATNYIWNQSQKEGIDNIAYALSKPVVLDSQYTWSLVLWTTNLQYPFEQLEIYTYDEHGENKQQLFQTKWFTQKELPLMQHQIYIIQVKYSQGICEYAFYIC
ncbi:MAG: hypothetical protein NC182_04970 [Prevotella sp.]|nr:hypothetical protein [Staphylococcus sp.]MCM1350535.1 hypothetical protein [Prevotella sp.]